jgi:hypothetical protein
MQRFMAFASTLCILLSGCSEPATGGLIGTWFGSTEELNPGYHRLELEITGSGRFQSGVRRYGEYPGQSTDDLSGFFRIEGTVRSVNDRLFFTLVRRIDWDLAYGDVPGTVEEPYNGPRTLEDVHYTLEEDFLTLQYTDYGSGLPMGVTLQLSRAP